MLFILLTSFTVCYVNWDCLSSIEFSIIFFIWLSMHSIFFSVYFSKFFLSFLKFLYIGNLLVAFVKYRCFLHVISFFPNSFWFFGFWFGWYALSCCFDVALIKFSYSSFGECLSNVSWRVPKSLFASENQLYRTDLPVCFLFLRNSSQSLLLRRFYNWKILL